MNELFTYLCTKLLTMAKSNVLTVEQYAKRCGVSKTAIYGRIARQRLSTIKLKSESGKDEAMYIDILVNPPKKLTAGRKKFVSR